MRSFAAKDTGELIETNAKVKQGIEVVSNVIQTNAAISAFSEKLSFEGNGRQI